MPAAQTRPTSQAVPQVPQLSDAVIRFTQTPSHSVKPDWHWMPVVEPFDAPPPVTFIAAVISPVELAPVVLDVLVGFE
jgi:hypothetical protein